MDTAPALLLLLTLGFGCPGIYGQSLNIQVRSPRDIKQLQVGQRLELECQPDRDCGVFWIHQDKKGTLHFIFFLGPMFQVTFDQRTAARFEVSSHNKTYILVVKSFTPQDEGNYFCVMNYNQMLFFSRGQPALLPATDVAAREPGPATQWTITEIDSNMKIPDPGSRMQEDLEHFCLVFLWIPLAGLCLLLLQLLATTIMLNRLKAHHNPL